MIEIVRYKQRNVKRWQDGDMRTRWTAAGMLVAEQQFRRIVGYRDLAKLVIAIERHAAQTTVTNPNSHSHKALRRAINDVVGEHALVHRRHRHKERNITDLLPDRDRPQVLARIRGAWALTDPLLAEQRLELLAAELKRTWPDAAASLREGMPETLTLMRFGTAGQLAKTLCSTNLCNCQPMGTAIEVPQRSGHPPSRLSCEVEMDGS